MKYLHIHNVSIHRSFYRNRFINECVGKAFLKFPIRRKDRVFFVRYKRTFVLNNWWLNRAKADRNTEREKAIFLVPLISCTAVNIFLNWIIPLMFQNQFEIISRLTRYQGYSKDKHFISKVLVIVRIIKKESSSTSY